jgi:uncharacterized protein (DUF433 family)
MIAVGMIDAGHITDTVFADYPCFERKDILAARVVRPGSNESETRRRR